VRPRAKRSARDRLVNSADLDDLVDAAETEVAHARKMLRTDAGEAVQAVMLAAYHAGAALQVARRERSAAMLGRAHAVFFEANKLAQSACGAGRHANMHEDDIGYRIRDELMQEAEDCGESGDVECMRATLKRARREFKGDPELLSDVETVVETYFPELLSKDKGALKRRLTR
jgi:hypothetical protein